MVDRGVAYAPVLKRRSLHSDSHEDPGLLDPGCRICLSDGDYGRVDRPLHPLSNGYGHPTGPRRKHDGNHGVRNGSHPVSQRVLADRTKRQHLLLAGAFALDAVGFAAFLLWPTIPQPTCSSSCSAGNRAPTTLILVMQGRYFGRKAFGSIMGTANLLRMPGAILAPVYAGGFFDRTGNYRTAFATFWG